MRERLHLLQCLCHAINPGLTRTQHNRLEADYAALSRDELTWLFNRADRALLLPGWHLGLVRKNLVQHLPQDLREALDAAWQLNRVRNQRLRGEAQIVSEALSEIDCRTVFLKGFGQILSGAYPDDGARMTTDMDVLVPADRLHEAARHLMSKGFLPVYGELALEHRAKWCHHLDGLTRRGMLTGVELHDGFLVDHPDWPCMPDILGRSEPVPDLPHARTPETRHAAHIAVAHSTLRDRHIAQEYLHLRDMVDLLFLAEHSAFNMLELRRDFRRAGHGAALGWFVAATDRLFGSVLGAAGATVTTADRNRAELELKRWVSRRALRPQSPVDRFRVRFQHLRRALTRPAQRSHLKALLTDPIYRSACRRRRNSNMQPQ